MDVILTGALILELFILLCFIQGFSYLKNKLNKSNFENNPTNIKRFKTLRRILYPVIAVLLILNVTSLIFVMIITIKELIEGLVSVDVLLIIMFIIEMIIFISLVEGIRYIKHKIITHKNITNNADMILPIEELQTLKQLSYLILATLQLVNIISLIFIVNGYSMERIFFDIIVSLISCVVIMDEDHNKAVLIGLIPFTTLLFSNCEIISYDFESISIVLTIIIISIHLITQLYFVRYYYKKFTKYTQEKRLGYTIVLLFIILVVTFGLTILSENHGILDSVVMISNAFTSNGYAVLGNTVIGKIASIVLVWSGYILSGVGTATLTLALFKKYNDKKIKKHDEKFTLFKKQNDRRMKKLEEKIDEQNKTNKKLIDLIEKQNELLSNKYEENNLIEKENELLSNKHEE